jgi:pimeloyl-ACP methyl ester carboxylesterase
MRAIASAEGSSVNAPLERLLSARRCVVPANGLAFEVFEAGEGYRLALLLHGFPQHAVSWHNQVTFLAGLGYRVWAVNQRGYGGTSRPKQRADYALDQLTGDVAGLIDASEATSVTLIGHDWGRSSLGLRHPRHPAAGTGRHRQEFGDCDDRMRRA